MTGARQDMPGYDRYIASHDKYMACTYYFFLKCVFITFESSISCSSHVLCMLAYSNIRKLSPSMKTWWWHYSYVPVIYLDIPLYTVIWRYMRVYVGISGCQDSRCLFGLGTQMVTPKAWQSSPSARGECMLTPTRMEPMAIPFNNSK